MSRAGPGTDARPCAAPGSHRRCPGQVFAREALGRPGPWAGARHGHRAASRFWKRVARLVWRGFGLRPEGRVEGRMRGAGRPPRSCARGRAEQFLWSGGRQGAEAGLAPSAMRPPSLCRVGERAALRGVRAARAGGARRGRAVGASGSPGPPGLHPQAVRTHHPHLCSGAMASAVTRPLRGGRSARAAAGGRAAGATAGGWAGAGRLQTRHASSSALALLATDSGRGPAWASSLAASDIGPAGGQTPPTPCTPHLGCGSATSLLPRPRHCYALTINTAPRDGLRARIVQTRTTAPRARPAASPPPHLGETEARSGYREAPTANPHRSTVTATPRARWRRPDPDRILCTHLSHACLPLGQGPATHCPGH